MSTDTVLVTRTAPTLDDVRTGGVQAVSLGRLERYELDGSWSRDPLVTIVGQVPGDDRSPMVVQLGRPRQVRRAVAADLSADLAVTAPDDGSGQLWLTDVTMVTAMDEATAERHFLALMAIAAPIASAHAGYFVLTSGGDPVVVALDGVPDPEPISLDEVPERPGRIPPAEVFVGAILPAADSAPTSWASVVDAVRTLCQRMPQSEPDHLLSSEQWQPMDAAGGPAPAWWPMQQSLFASRGQFSWLVDGLEQTEHGATYTVHGRGPAPQDASPALGQGLVALAGGPIDYGYAHAWHPDEPRTGPVGPRMTGNGPWFGLVARDLDEGLPNIYWLQVLGPRWVERLGADRIASTPAHRVAEIGSDRWLIQVAPSLAAVTDDFPAFLRARDAAVDHLGREHFPYLR